MTLEEYIKKTIQELENRTFTYLSIIEYAKDNNIDITVLEKDIYQSIKKELITNRTAFKRIIHIDEFKQVKKDYLLLKRINILSNILYGIEKPITRESLIKMSIKEYNNLQNELSNLCYEYAKTVDIDILESNLSSLLGMAIQNVVSYLRKGFNANDIMSYNIFKDSQTNKKGINKVPSGKYSKYIYELDMLTDELQIKDYLKKLKEDNIRLEKIKEYIYVYVMKKYINESNEFKDNKEKELKSKLKLYKKERTLSTKKELNIDDITKAENLITAFIDEGITLKEYLIKNNIPESAFRKNLNIVKKNNLDLYEKYKDRTRSNTYMHFANEIRNAKVIINEINNNPDFNLLDFYMMTSKEPSEYYKLIRNLMDEKELLPLKIFANENYLGKVWNELRIKTYYKMAIIIDEEILTDEEKDEIINYLKDNKIPITSKTISLSMKAKNRKTLKKIKRI